VQLHLTPLHAVVQMRPELAHIDAADAQRRQEEAAAKEGAESEEATQAVKPISVQYRKVDSERVADIKRSSFAHLQDKVDREKWVNLRVTPKSVRIVLVPLKVSHSSLIPWLLNCSLPRLKTHLSR
jgi:DNA-directed RNA polymerase-3 subunit RPC5